MSEQERPELPPIDAESIELSDGPSGIRALVYGLDFRVWRGTYRDDLTRLDDRVYVFGPYGGHAIAEIPLGEDPSLEAIRTAIASYTPPVVVEVDYSLPRKGIGTAGFDEQGNVQLISGPVLDDDGNPLDRSIS